MHQPDGEEPEKGADQHIAEPVLVVVHPGPAGARGAEEQDRAADGPRFQRQRRRQCGGRRRVPGGEGGGAGEGTELGREG